MTETNEPSYYEVALTNRQVLVSFVVLLGCILTAFVFGVWVGKEGSDPAVDSVVAGSDQEMAKLEELQFFNEDDEPTTGSGSAEDGLDRPDLSELFESSGDTTLAQDIGSQRPDGGDPKAATPSSAPPPAAAPPAAPPPAASGRESPAKQESPPKQAPPPARQATPSTATAEGFIVQVFSSHDQVQANKILQQMKQGGYRAFLSPLQRQGSQQVMYRVRLGPYAERSPADAAAQDIRRQFKLDTWVTAASN